MSTNATTKASIKTTIKNKSKTELLLSLHGISKSYPGNKANDGVDFAIKSGEIHALLGENGAGKSTLVKIIYGILQPDSGSIHWRGQERAINNPSKARDLGIGMVFQHFSLFEAMTVEDNISLGLPDAFLGKDLAERIVRISTEYGLPLNPAKLVHELSVGEKQRVEIVRCLLQQPKLLIMDEPTSVLTPQEANGLFETLRKLAKEGCSILYISHRLNEIRTLCHNATIMRLGKVVSRCDPSKESAQSLAEMMMGASLKAPVRASGTAGDVLFEAETLCSQSSGDEAVALCDISFTIKAGEILGIAGLAGNGQDELLQALNGEQRNGLGGDVRIAGRSILSLSPSQRRQAGLSSTPEQRLGHSAVADFSLWENTLLSARERQGLVGSGFIRITEAQAFADKVIATYSVKTTGNKQSAGSLSGGNLQKFVMGRELLQNPDVCVALQPTWGVDAGSAATIHQSLIDLAAQGKAVLIISQDIDELFAVCSHISVIFEGGVSPAQPIKNITVESIGLLMGGISEAGTSETGTTEKVAS